MGDKAREQRAGAAEGAEMARAVREMAPDDRDNRAVIEQENVRLTGEVRRLRAEIDALRGSDDGAAARIRELERQLSDCVAELRRRAEAGDGVEDPLAVDSPSVPPPADPGGGERTP